jgi:hypothetical protein
MGPLPGEYRVVGTITELATRPVPAKFPDTAPDREARLVLDVRAVRGFLGRRDPARLGCTRFFAAPEAAERFRVGDTVAVTVRRSRPWVARAVEPATGPQWRAGR